MAWADVNGARLYYERRGSGPAVLFISGASGDAGHWTGIADAFADEYTVITYDRRGNSRSPRPADWTTTTMLEQADDAAELLAVLELTPAVAFGTSAAAGILAALCLRHPDVLRGAIFHEPPFPSGVSTIDQVRAGRRKLVDEGLAQGGPRLATELFLRSVMGDEAYASLDRELRDRLLGNADVLLGIEIDHYLTYDPSPAELRSIRIPRVVTAGATNRDPEAAGHWRYEAAEWLAHHLDTPLVELPGGHMAYLADPQPFAKALRPHVCELT
ncbi:alpha/beta fold hydrolase [Kribbella amoyensis]|nr:alpha/beta fold hydrolase [Kribbella amoyensis]